MVSHIVYTFSTCQEVVLSVFAHYYSCHSGVHIGPHLCLYFAPATPSPIGQFPANHCHSLAVFLIGQFPANHCHSPADFPIGQFPANHCHSPAVFVVGSLFVSDECRNTHLLLDLNFSFNPLTSGAYTWTYNLSNAKASFVQSTRMQIFLKNI